MRKEVLKILTGNDEQIENVPPDNSAVRASGWGVFTAAATLISAAVERTGIIPKDPGLAAIDQAVKTVRASKADKLSDEEQLQLVEVFLDARAQDLGNKAYGQFGHLLYHLRVENKNTADVKNEDLIQAFIKLRYDGNFSKENYKSVIESKDPLQKLGDIKLKEHKIKVAEQAREEKAAQQEAEEPVFDYRDPSFDSVEAPQVISTPTANESPGQETIKTDEVALEQLSVLENQIKAGKDLLGKEDLKRYERIVANIKGQIKKGNPPKRYFDAIASTILEIEVKQSEYQDKKSALIERYNDLFHVRAKEINERMKNIDAGLSNQDFENEYASLSGDIEKLNTEYAELKKDYEALYRKKATVGETGRFSKLERAFSKFDRDMQKLQEKRALQKEVKKLNTRYNELSGRAREVSAAMSALNVAKAEEGYSDRLSEIEDTIAELKSETDNLKAQLYQVFGEGFTGISGGKLERLDEKLRELEAEYADLKEQYAQSSVDDELPDLPQPDIKGEKKVERRVAEFFDEADVLSETMRLADIDKDQKSVSNELEEIEAQIKELEKGAQVLTQDLREVYGDAVVDEVGGYSEKLNQKIEELNAGMLRLRTQLNPEPETLRQSGDESSRSAEDRSVPEIQEDSEDESSRFTEEHPLPEIYEDSEDRSRSSFQKVDEEGDDSSVELGAWSIPEDELALFEQMTPSEGEDVPVLPVENQETVANRENQYAAERAKINGLKEKIEGYSDEGILSREVNKLNAMVDKGNVSAEFRNNLKQLEEAVGLYSALNAHVEREGKLNNTVKPLKEGFDKIRSSANKDPNYTLKKYCERLYELGETLQATQKLNDNPPKAKLSVGALKERLMSHRGQDDKKQKPVEKSAKVEALKRALGINKKDKQGPGPSRGSSSGR